MEYYELYIPPSLPTATEKVKRAARPKIAWTDERLKVIREKFATTFNKDLAKELGCSWRSVVRKARELGLEKEEGFLDNNRKEIVKLIAAVRKPNATKGLKGWTVPGGEKFQFKKGHIPAMFANRHLVEKVHATRNATIRRERIRLKYGLEPVTKLRLKA